MLEKTRTRKKKERTKQNNNTVAQNVSNAQNLAVLQLKMQNGRMRITYTGGENGRNCAQKERKKKKGETVVWPYRCHAPLRNIREKRQKQEKILQALKRANHRNLLNHAGARWVAMCFCYFQSLLRLLFYLQR